MAHEAQRVFVNKIKTELSEFFQNKKVLEVGSLNINGSVRDFFNDCNYVGLDVGAGEGVDVVCGGEKYAAPDSSFDVTCSAECFEHNPYWVDTVKNMIRLTRSGGLIFFTCATEGRAEHGTNRSDTESSPLTIKLGWDYYRNLTEADFISAIDFNKYFTSYEFDVNTESHDLYFYGIRNDHPSEFGEFYKNKPIFNNILNGIVKFFPNKN